MHVLDRQHTCVLIHVRFCPPWVACDAVPCYTDLQHSEQIICFFSTLSAQSSACKELQCTAVCGARSQGLVVSSMVCCVVLVHHTTHGMVQYGVLCSFSTTRCHTVLCIIRHGQAWYTQWCHMYCAVGFASASCHAEFSVHTIGMC